MTAFSGYPSLATTTQTDGTVREPVEQGSTGGALWFGRLLSTLGILVVFGGLALISVGWPEGPEYVVTVRFLRAAWVLSMLGTILYVIAYTADFGPVMRFLYWNMNYHAEHHIAPSVPFHALPALHARLRAHLYVETKGYLGAHREILGQLCAARRGDRQGSMP